MIFTCIYTGIRLPWWLKGKESTGQCRKGGFDPWVKQERTTHSSILAWEILWTEESGVLQSHGVAKIRHDLATKQHNNNTGARVS